MAGGTAFLRSMARFVPQGAARVFGRPVAFFFHGVERRIEDPDIQRNQHSVDVFYRLMQAMRADFNVLPLSALPDVLRAPARHKRAAFLMSDDGYRNTLTVAADVLDSLGLPWSLFVSTHHIDTGELNPFTAARLFYRFAPSGKHLIPHLGTVTLARDDMRARQAHRGLKALQRLDPDAGFQAVEAMLAAIPESEHSVLEERFASERFLNWSEVAALHRRGVEIGAHAHRHWPMHKQNPAAQEALTAKRHIEHQIAPCHFFAYPFGQPKDIAPAAWQAVRDAGYTHGFATLGGSLDGGRNRYLLPRLALPGKPGPLGSFAPLTRMGNPRLARWQKRMS